MHCPIDESFQSCDPIELDPIVEHLNTGKFVAKETAFTRGTHLPDGRLDLCKQSIGPDGARRIATALTKNPKTRHWLLGANGLRDEGAAEVANTIGENESIETVYLGCNQIGHVGAKKLATALVDNQQVTGLWLKRNPIGYDGATAIAEMLNRNRTLRTLCLLYTSDAADE